MVVARVSEELRDMKIKATYRVENGSAGEDRAFVERVGDRTIAIICDGAGNGGRGGVAADIAIKYLSELARGGGFVDWMRALSQANTLVRQEAQGGETTCVVVDIAGNGECRGASVGDSGAWIIPASKSMMELTEAQGRSRLGCEQAHPRRFVGQFMGTLIVASDGLHKYLPRHAWKSLVHRGVDALVDAVRLPNGAFHDDVSVILLE